MNNTKSDRLTHLVGVRLTAKSYYRLEYLKRQSNCTSLGEFARRILLKEEITWYHKDASMEGAIEELAGIRNELRAIGININQVTRHFNHAQPGGKKTFEALRILEEYRRVSDCVDEALKRMTTLANQWSQR